MFEVRDASTRETLPGIPSPLLIQTGYGEAYDAGTPEHPFWRLRDDKYDPAGTQYRRVTIVRVDGFIVNVEMQAMDPSDENAEPFEDTFRVVATSGEEARRLAPAVAVKTYQEREDVPYMATVTRVSKEF